MNLVMGDKKRITVMLDERIVKLSRNRQANKIAKDQASFSFSKQINEDLAKFYKMTNFKY